MEELIKHTCFKKNTVTAYLKIPIIILISFVLSFAELFGLHAPFGAAFMSGLYGAECVWSFCGSCLGFFLSGGDFFHTLPDLAAVFAVGAVRLILPAEKKHTSVVCAFFTATAVFISGFFTAEAVSEILMSAGLAAIGGVCSYSMAVLRDCYEKSEKSLPRSAASTAAACVIYTFICAAVSGAEFHILNASAVFIGLVSLVCGEKYGVAKTAAAAALGCCGSALANGENAVWCVILPASAMTGAAISPKGKITQAAGTLLTAAVLAFLTGANGRELMLTANMLISSLLFAAAPTDELEHIISKSKRQTLESSEPLHIFSDKLREIGNTMGEIQNAVLRTSDALDKECVKDISWVYTSVCEKICRNCKNNMICWGEEYNQTADIMNHIVSAVRLGRQATGEDFYGALSERCTRKTAFAAALNCQYSAYVNANIANRKISEMRKILISQLNATEKLMTKTAEDFEKNNLISADKSLAAEKILRNHGMKNVTASVVIVDGKMTVEAYGDGVPDIARERLCEITSAALQREMDLPEIHTDMKKTKITMFERAKFCAETKYFQFNKGQNAYCGDYFDTFTDGHGNLFAIISDGMGSGSRARIDAAFACGMLIKLLRSGVDTETAICMLNNALLVKSGDESFATLDICKIDLYSGRGEIVKAGGSFSYVKCGKEVSVINGSGTPVGINHSVQTRSSIFTVSDGDIVFMVSDGAEINRTWLENVTNGDYSLEEMVEIIASSARNSAEKKHGDDITVAAVRILK